MTAVHCLDNPTYITDGGRAQLVYSFTYSGGAQHLDTGQSYLL